MLEILFEDEVMLAVNKPSGILTQAARGIESLEVEVKEYLAGGSGDIERGDDLRGIYLGVPHRLDRPVSGVILFGKTSRATHRLSEQFEDRKIDKTYWAVVSGMVKEDNGTWIDYMRKVPDHPIAEIIQPINPDAREAILLYKVLKRFEIDNNPFTHLEIKLETGRMHQIRLQASTHGHPVLGDATYGSTFPFGENFDNDRRREIALHARSISFTTPKTRQKINLIAQTPKLWNSLELQQ